MHWKREKYSNVKLPLELYDRIEREALKRGMSANELVRLFFMLGFVALEHPLYVKDGEGFRQVMLTKDGDYGEVYNNPL